MKIALNPSNVTKVQASYHGGEFSFEIPHFTLSEQEEYDSIVESSIEEKDTVGKFYRKRWDYAIRKCTLENPFDVLGIEDIKNVLIAVNDVNSGIAEKES